MNNQLNNNNGFLSTICDGFCLCGSIIYKICKFLYEVTGIYIVWIILHYVASHLYIKFCVPSTPSGFLLSPFMTAAPHCQGLRWIVYNGAGMINHMWIVLGTWVCANLLVVKRA
jgi:hypothetical protein